LQPAADGRGNRRPDVRRERHDCAKDEILAAQDSIHGIGPVEHARDLSGGYLDEDRQRAQEQIRAERERSDAAGADERAADERALIPQPLRRVRRQQRCQRTNQGVQADDHPDLGITRPKPVAQKQVEEGEQHGLGQEHQHEGYAQGIDARSLAKQHARVKVTRWI